MLDIGWSELVLIGVAALIVVGPKDLPNMFRTLGRFTAKARAMSRDFSRAMEDAAKAAGVDESVRDLKAMTSKKALGLDALESAAAKFEKWDPMKPAAPKPAAATPEAGADQPAPEATPVVQAAPSALIDLAPKTEAPAAAAAAEPAPAEPKATARLRSRSPKPKAPETVAAPPAAAPAGEAHAEAAAPTETPAKAPRAAAKPRAPRAKTPKGEA